MIRFNCPTCRAVLETADVAAGTKFPCPHCGQRLQAPVPRDKTVLGEMLASPITPGADKPPGVAVVVAAPPPSPVYEDVPEAVVVPDGPPRRSAGPRRRRGFRCPYCGSTYRPIVRSEISQAGWILFAVLLVVFFPLCFLGLFMKEEYRACSDCGAKLPGGRQSFG
jgi:DNA-directed RNA polymerase subunit RPC12/RpoP